MPHAPSAAWLDRFTTRLSHLLPSLTIDEAARIALATFPDGGELVPEDAAEIYALEPPDADSVSPMVKRC
jgi:hypothetical protein